MGSPILFLRLEGPLQSWGVRSRWSRRDTGPEPTKSAIIGLLGCAAGIPRHDWRSTNEPDRTLEEWDRALHFGVRVDRPGVMETDYHTVQGRHWQADELMKTAKSRSGIKPEKALLEPPHTEVSWRDYLHDSAFLVALQEWDGGSALLGVLRDHLAHPRWPLYLGRKACVPSRPLLDRLTKEEEYVDVETALRVEPWSMPRQFPALHRRIRHGPNRKCAVCRDHGPRAELTAWIEDPAGDHERADALRLNQLRFYDVRRCRRIDVPTENLSWSLQ